MAILQGSESIMVDYTYGRYSTGFEIQKLILNHVH